MGILFGSICYSQFLAKWCDIFAPIKNVGFVASSPPVPSSVWGGLITADIKILKVVTTVYVNLLTFMLFICFINCLM